MVVQHTAQPRVSSSRDALAHANSAKNWCVKKTGGCQRPVIDARDQRVHVRGRQQLPSASSERAWFVCFCGLLKLLALLWLLLLRVYIW